MTPWRRARDLPGVLVRDVPRYLAALRRSHPERVEADADWASLCNRMERLHRADDDIGYLCDWPLGSALHAPEVLPVLGRKLMGASLRQWPIRFAARPSRQAMPPQVTFVLAHAGKQRLPQLLRTLQSLFAQDDIACEYLVVDQSPDPVLDDIPEGVVYRHLDKTRVAQGWHKAWAFNVGARLARADILVFHDGDICVPAGYARELVRAFGDGRYAAASLQRLLFYLGKADTGMVEVKEDIPHGATPVLAFQNWKGGTIAVRRDAFAAIGGFDEGFVDWGGEDDEFYDRCAEIGHLRAGYLPFVHLWHPPQAKRMATDNPNTARILPSRLTIPRSQRVTELCARSWGRACGPDPEQRYA